MMAESEVGTSPPSDFKDAAGLITSQADAQSETDSPDTEERMQGKEKRTHRRGAGFHQFGGLTPFEIEALQALLEPNVRTYEDAATRLGISKWAMEKRMQRVYARYDMAKAYCNRIEEFRRKRRLHKKGVRV